MFDIGFLELVLLGFIGLIVLGPDRLPGALRTAGLWIGRLRRSFNSIKADIEREVGADEVRRQLRNEAIMEKIKNTRTQVTQGLDSVKKQAEAVKQDIGLDKELKELSGSGGPKSAPATETPPPPPPPIPPRPAGEQHQAAPGETPSVPPSAAPQAEPVPEPAPLPQAERKESGQK